MPARLLVLGIDAASPALLSRWAADGKLPAIRSLMDRGTSGSVRGVDGFYIGSTWPSLYTGLNPASHGFYRIVQLKSGSYNFFSPLESPVGVGGVPFWKLASDAGRRVAVLDVPLTRIEPGLNGLQIVEWGGHDAVFGFHASSPEAFDRVMSKVGAYPLPSNCDGHRVTAADFEQFVNALESGAKKKAEVTIDFLGQEHWDLFVQVFTEAHCAGHQCWHIHDAAHPAHDSHVLGAIGDPLERVYRAIDRAVAAIVEQAGDAHILLFCAHGMGPYRGAPFLLAEILFRLGATVRPSAASQPKGPRDRLVAAARVGWRMLPRIAQESLRSCARRLVPRGSADRRVADVSKSRCFPVPNGSPVGGIRLNLVGREPQGILQPGPEVDGFCDELTRNLCAIVDERTGRPLIAAVHRTDSLYAGPRRDALPDLLVEWNGDPPTGSVAHAGGRGAKIRATSAKIGTVDGSNSYGRTGEHLPNGMFICAGPGVPRIQRQEPVSLMDLHPTICRLLDLAEPSVDGAVIPELAMPAASPAHHASQR